MKIIIVLFPSTFVTILIVSMEIFQILFYSALSLSIIIELLTNENNNDNNNLK